MAGSIICENCRAANHRECMKPLVLSSTTEGNVKRSKVVCCDDVLRWTEQQSAE